MATSPNGVTDKPQLVFGEILNFAYDTFCQNKVRFTLTALGMVIGTASLILVVTIGLTGKHYILSQIEAIGSNLIYADYPGNSGVGSATPDPLTVEDVQAVQAQVRSVVGASPFSVINDRVSIGGGRQQDIVIAGVFAEYRRVRNLGVTAGRFFDVDDARQRNKVAVLNQKLAAKMYGNDGAAVGQVITLGGLPFTIIGCFKEAVETFGQSELQDNTVLIPFSVSRYFTGTNVIKEAYFSVANREDVARATEEIRRVVRSRHRPDSTYNVENLTQLLEVANRAANALTVVLLLIAAVTLLVSGVGIMNIMLATVSQRTREIGIRKAVGATNREIRLQFLAEAILISLMGGIVGILIGLAIPFSMRYLTDFRIPISGLSAIVAIVVSSLVGVLFGTVPAARAAQLDPVESLRYE